MITVGQTGRRCVEINEEILSGDEFLRLILLVAERLWERGNPRDDAGDHEEERDDGPDDAPALRGAAVPLCEDAGVGTVHFAKDEIVALQKAHLLARNQNHRKVGRGSTHDIPDAVKRRHDADEQLATKLATALAGNTPSTIPPPPSQETPNLPQQISTPAHGQ